MRELDAAEVSKVGGGAALHAPLVLDSHVAALVAPWALPGVVINLPIVPVQVFISLPAPSPSPGRDGRTAGS